MPYRIEFTRAAGKDLDRIAPPGRNRIIRKTMELARNPRPAGVKKLAGADDLYRIRVGNYRVIYQVRDKIVTVTVVRIGHRRDVYKAL